MGFENFFLFLEPLKEMMVRIVSFIPTLVIASVILIVGWLLTDLVTKLFVKLLKTVDFDKISDAIHFSNFLKNGGIREKPSDMLGCLTYWVLMIMVLITTVKALGLAAASHMIDTILVYIPHVVSGVVVVIVGMLLARFVAAVIYITAKNTDMPAPATLGKLTKLAILVYVAIIFLKEVGLDSIFVGQHYTILIGGIVFAIALAFGLAGKDVAGKYMGFLNIKKSSHG